MENAKIMVIDDEESMCRFMQIMLQKEGYDVTSTVSSKEALEEMKDKDYDLVIADLMMPEMAASFLGAKLPQVKKVDLDELVKAPAGAAVRSRRGYARYLRAKPDDGGCTDGH